jgi:hypothetical protein
MWKPSKAAHPLTNAFTNLSAAGALALALAGCNDTAAQHAAPIRPVLVAAVHYEAQARDRSFVLGSKAIWDFGLAARCSSALSRSARC